MSHGIAAGSTHENIIKVLPLGVLCCCQVCQHSCLETRHAAAAQQQFQGAQSVGESPADPGGFERRKDEKPTSAMWLYALASAERSIWWPAACGAVPSLDVLNVPVTRHLGCVCRRRLEVEA